MSKRPAWGHVSRKCVNCGKVGPRTMVAYGWVHKYCLPKNIAKSAGKRRMTVKS